MPSAQLIRSIHASARAAGLGDDDRKAAQLRLTGKASSTEMTDSEAQMVVDHFNASVRKAIVPRGRAHRVTGPYAGKLQALWIALWNLGLVHNRDDAALIAFARRQTGLEHPQFLRDAPNARRVIEAMKNWASRERGVLWSNPDLQFLGSEGAVIALAQVQFLEADKTAGEQVLAFVSIAAHLSGRKAVARPGDLTALTKADWIKVMNSLGEYVRAKVKGGAA